MLCGLWTFLDGVPISGVERRRVWADLDAMVPMLRNRGLGHLCHRAFMFPGQCFLETVTHADALTAAACR
jgi:hypothetical protein